MRKRGSRNPKKVRRDLRRHLDRAMYMNTGGVIAGWITLRGASKRFMKWWATEMAKPLECFVGVWHGVTIIEG